MRISDWSSDVCSSDLLHIPVGRPAGVVWLLAFTALLLALPVAAQAWGDNLLSMFDAFFRAGSLVFGGGHVLLPLLQAEVVPTGWVSNETFLAGYEIGRASCRRSVCQYV